MNMTIQDLLDQKNESMYWLSKRSMVPYTTLNDLCNGRTRIERCNVETVRRIANALNMTIDELLDSCTCDRASFENFKSTICHRVKQLGDLAFIASTIKSDAIRTYYRRKWYPESLYLLAMLDYISNENHIPICSDYNDIRRCRLKEPIYPAGIRAMYIVSDDEAILRSADESAIPEFKRFNIIEREVRNVV